MAISPELSKAEFDRIASEVTDEDLHGPGWIEFNSRNPERALSVRKFAAQLPPEARAHFINGVVFCSYIETVAEHESALDQALSKLFTET